MYEKKVLLHIKRVTTNINYIKEHTNHLLFIGITGVGGVVLLQQ